MKKDCPLCNKRIINETGRRCKICGMPLKNKLTDFCSKKCENRYKDIKNE